MVRRGPRGKERARDDRLGELVAQLAWTIEHVRVDRYISAVRFGPAKGERDRPGVYLGVSVTEKCVARDADPEGVVTDMSAATASR